MAFVHPGGQGIDYDLCRYGTSRLLVRGPRARLVPPFAVFIGGTETFGRFVRAPFAQRVAGATGMTAVNLGCINGGLDAVAEDTALMGLAARADTTVIQILGAANLSNPFYTVHARRNDRFIAATPALKDLYPDVDFTEFAFTRHLLSTLEARCEARFERVANALKDMWRLQMHRLMAEAGAPCILLWIAAAPPPGRATRIRGAPDPLLVDRAMVEEFAARADALVVAVPSRTARATGLRGMVFTDFEAHIAEATMNDAAHDEIARALAPAIGRRSSVA